MRFYFTNTMKSTQNFLLEELHKNSHITTPFVVITQNQTQGIGSRGNTWEQVECGLYCSCAIHKEKLPNDLSMQSASIYFGFILLEILREFQPNLWLKWPNDFYLKDSKIGGLLTHAVKNFVVFGIGINIASSHFNALIQPSSITQNNSQHVLSAIIQRILHFLGFKHTAFDFTKTIDYVEKSECNIFLESQLSWFYIFNKYKQEFNKNYDFMAHDTNNNTYISLKDAILQDDGSILLDNRIIYSLR